MNRLKISYRSVLNHYLTLIIIGVVFAIIKQEICAILIFVFLVFIIDFIPTLYIILNYLKYTSKKEVVFFDEAITIIEKSLDRTILKSQIKQIFVFATPSFEKRIYYLVFAKGFYYARLKLTNGEDIILTSLLGPNLYENLLELGNEKIIRMEGTFNTIKE
jgi:hypothetical protein